MAEGDNLYVSGNFEDAISVWSEASAAYASTNDRCGNASALARRAEAYQALGFHGKSLADYCLAADLIAGGGKTEEAAGIIGGLGNAYFMAGQAKAAEDHLRRSISLAREGGLNAVTSISLTNLGNVLASTDKQAEAMELYREGANLAEQGRFPLVAANARINAARLLIAKGETDMAQPVLRRAAEALGRAPLSHEKAYALLAISRLLRRLEAAVAQSSPARRQLTYQTVIEARRIAVNLNDLRALSYAEGYLGTLYEDAGRAGDALELTKRALASAQRVNAPEILYLWHWQMGRLLREQDRIESAIKSYRLAVEQLDLIRDDLTNDYRSGRRSFREAVGPVFLELADLLLRRAPGLEDRDLAQRLLVGARQTIEQLKAAELRDYFRDECVTALEAKITKIDRLEARTAALYPILLPDRLELLLSLADGIRQVTVPISGDDVTAEVRKFRLRLEKRTTRQYMRHGRKLYDWLIRPLEAILTKNAIETLVFIPDGPLRTIPLAALHDGKDFLISRFALAVTPGLDLVDPRPIPRDDIQVMLSGLTEAVQGYPALPFVESELDTIGGLYGGRLLRNKAFRVAAVEQELSETEFGIVHIASHGEFDSDPSKTFILTFEGKLTMDGLEKFIKLGRFRENPVELLTLSACRTAAGDDRAAMGLAGVAIKAGARSALATLWFINDSASSTLVIRFYRELKNPAISKAKALRLAQLSLIGDRRYRHPGYWSPFLLIGNWL